MLDAAYITTLRSYKQSILDDDPHKEGIMDAFIEHGLLEAADRFSAGKLPQSAILLALDYCIGNEEAAV